MPQIDDEVVQSLKEQLGRLVIQKIEVYPSVQEAGADNNVAISMIKLILEEKWAEVSLNQLIYVAECFGIEVVIGTIEDPGDPDAE